MTDDLTLGAAGRALAVTYLRVSTKEQAEKGGTDEGFSIPAQRTANTKKADELDALVVEEFVDAGESARKADRPALQSMLEFVARHHITYCIVHKVDRLARNRADDVAIHLALKQAGVVLVSATENIDETPSGMLLHGIMSTIAEFYSRNLATEVVKGMTQKAKTGGTPTKAPIGYINVQVRDHDGRRVRTVETDPERGPLIAWAFKAYASGNWTVAQLREELTRRGLVTLPTPKHPSKPIAKSYLYKVLSNPYYKGQVVYRGQMYKGSHTPLVPPEVFLQVQAVLAANAKAELHTQKHDHYLKGTVYCGGCRSRLILTNAKSHTGDIYPYFICSGRQRKATDCQMQAIHVERVERLVADHYTTVTIPAPVRAKLRQEAHADFDQMMAEAHHDLEDLLAQKKRIEDQQDRLVDAHLEGALSIDVLTRKQKTLEERLALLNHDIAACRQDYKPARANMDAYLFLASDPHAMYLRANNATRRLANQTFFTKIFITENPRRPGHDRHTVTTTLGQPFAAIHDHAVALDARPTDPTRPPTRKKKAGESKVEAGQGLNQTSKVRQAGLEPARPRAQEPKSCASANSATGARIGP